jgi:hypothetical protein
MGSRFSEEEAWEIFKLLPNNLFTSEKSDYQATVQTAVDKYIREQSATKLKEMWREKTQTDNPRQWSKKYRTPILCMIPDKDVPAARAVFGTLNRKQPDTASIDKAIEYLKRADFFDCLSSQEERDKAFRENIVKSYSVKYNETGCDKALEKIDSMDVADVKQYLKRLIKDNIVIGMEIIKGK